MQRQHSGKVKLVHMGPCILLDHHLVMSIAGQSLVPTRRSQPSVRLQNVEGSQNLGPQGLRSIWPVNIIRRNLWASAK